MDIRELRNQMEFDDKKLLAELSNPTMKKILEEENFSVDQLMEDKKKMMFCGFDNSLACALFGSPSTLKAYLVWRKENGLTLASVAQLNMRMQSQMRLLQETLQNASHQTNTMDNMDFDKQTRLEEEKLLDQLSNPTMKKILEEANFSIGELMEDKRTLSLCGFNHSLTCELFGSPNTLMGYLAWRKNNELTMNESTITKVIQLMQTLEKMQL